MIRFLLFKSHQNSGCPIKREDLTQIVTKNYRQRNLATHVINEAKSKLSKVFGYDLKELQRTKPSSTGQSRLPQSQSKTIDYYYFFFNQTQALRFRHLAKCVVCLHCSSGSVESKSYVLVSQLPIDVFRKYVVEETTSPVTGFTFAVLAIVQLAGGKIPEGVCVCVCVCMQSM